MVEGIKQGNSVLGILPKGNVWSDYLTRFCCQGIVEMTGLWAEDVLLDPADKSIHLPLSIIRQQMDYDAPQGVELPSVQTFLQTTDLPDLIIISGLERLEAEVQQTWLDFLLLWQEAAHAIKSAEGRNMPCLLLFLPLEVDNLRLPQADTGLLVSWWWSLPTVLEVQLLCRLSEGGEMLELTGNEAWREAILAELVGNDLPLLDYLWDYVFEPPKKIIECLAHYARQRGWTQAKLESWGVPSLVQGSGVSRQLLRAPLAAHRSLWAEGLLSRTPERGVEVSLAALVVLKRLDQVKHRLWRAQSRLILPILDEWRLEICAALTQQYGREWVDWGPTPQTEEQKKQREQARLDPLTTEWGALKWALFRQPMPETERFLKQVTWAQKARNILAHYQLVSFETYEQLLMMKKDS